MERLNDENLRRLLTRILNGQATEGEVKQFAEWIKDLDNERFFEQYKEMWHASGDPQIGEGQVDRSLSVFVNYIRASRRKQAIKSRWLYSVSAAAMIILAFSIFDRNNGNTFSNLKFNNEVIRIELADGSVIDPAQQREINYLDQESLSKLQTSQSAQINQSTRQIAKTQQTSPEPASQTLENKVKKSVAYNSVTIPPGERFAIILSDGTKVYLNSNSYIRYPVSFEGDSREVTITGRAYFDVAKSNVPFIVNTSDLKVEVLGTSFDVESMVNGKNTSVILVEGSVKILADGQSRIMEPDEKLAINRHNRDITVSNVDAKSLTLWKDGILVLKENSFDEMLETLSTWYGVEIINKSTISKSERFNGRFDRENIASAIETIALSAKVSYRIVGGKLVIEDINERKN